MQRSRRWMMFVALLAPALLLAVVLQAQSGARGRDGAAGGPAQPSAFLAGGLTTLHALDPISRTMNFSRGQYGGVIQDHMVMNRNSDIDFGSYAPGAFTVGIEGGRTGAIVDCGPSDDLSRRYGFQETVGGGQGYASIRFVDGELHILADEKTRTTQPLTEAEALVPDGKSMSSPVNLGHVYLVRILDRHDESFELVAKFMVVEHRQDETVTIRWQRLR